MSALQRAHGLTNEDRVAAMRGEGFDPALTPSLIDGWMWVECALDGAVMACIPEMMNSLRVHCSNQFINQLII